MKLKIYSIALMAFISLVICNTASYAQQAPAAQSTPPTATAYGNGQSFSSTTPNAYELAPGMYSQLSQDTTYQHKMQKLRDQMRELNKQMSDLNKEESKKNGVASQQRMAVRMKEMHVRLDSNFSRSFNRSFGRSFSSSFRFNFDDNSNLEKQVQSGEVKEKEKAFSKSYPADGNDKLQIDNSYGKITVITWAKNEFKVDIQIKAYAKEDDDAQKLIDQTNITNNKENNVVAFKTIIDHSDNSWWGTRMENGKLTGIRKVVINYTIYMPARSPLTINNRYGGIILPDLDGKLIINNSYGSLVAKTLSNSDNMIAVKYGSADISSLIGSNINVAYGSLNLQSADNLKADISYGPAKIGKLITSGTFNIRYGDGLEILELGKNLKDLSVNSDYAPIKVNVNPNMNADFNVSVHYTQFTYDDNAVNVTSKIPGDEKNWSATRTFKGNIGKGSPDKTITIKANYGAGVKFD